MVGEYLLRGYDYTDPTNFVYLGNTLANASLVSASGRTTLSFTRPLVLNNPDTYVSFVGWQ